MMRRNALRRLTSRSATVFLVLLPVMFGSAVQHAHAQRVLIVESNDPEANLFVDENWIGTANGQPVPFPNNAKQLVVTSSRPDTWSVSPLEFILDPSAESGMGGDVVGDGNNDDSGQAMGAGNGIIARGDTVRVTARFPYYYKIESIPFDADVYAVTTAEPNPNPDPTADPARTRLGKTPMLIVRNEPMTQTLIVSRNGYDDAQVEPGAEIWNRVFVQLTRSDPSLATGPDIDFTRSNNRRRWVDALIAGMAVTGGVLAVRYRAKADRLYDDYQALDGDDPALRHEIKRLDGYSIASLGLMQVGVGVFVFRVAF